ncbi:MAG: isoprenylcysteine carboxylmethyltransferase family protein [Mariprofundaceae bacterium]|nr:isoprenylcysteine carboxylmethyltransferase family protein [Mariprofundaceae bacterium]
MNRLKLKIPPPIVGILFAVMIWLLSKGQTVQFIDQENRQIIALLLLAIAGTIDVWAILSFRSAKTTIDPRYPHKTSSIVSHGIYTLTRNPMYLGLVLILLSLSIYLGTLWGLLCVLAFILYMNKFQIEAEEAYLEKQFGSLYLSYKSRVRRWV